MLRAARQGMAAVGTEDVYDLVLLATNDVSQAERAYKDRLHGDLKAGREPKV